MAGLRRKVLDTLLYFGLKKYACSVYKKEIFNLVKDVFE